MLFSSQKRNEEFMVLICLVVAHDDVRGLTYVA